MCQACKDLKRATNLPKGAEFFHAAEKELSNVIQQGKLPPESRTKELYHFLLHFSDMSQCGTAGVIPEGSKFSLSIRCWYPSR